MERAYEFNQIKLVLPNCSYLKLDSLSEEAVVPFSAVKGEK